MRVQGIPKLGDEIVSLKVKLDSEEDRLQHWQAMIDSEKNKRHEVELAASLVVEDSICEKSTLVESYNAPLQSISQDLLKTKGALKRLTD